MAKYVFTRWEAIDLFVRIIAKYENKEKQDVEADLRGYLNKYKRLELSTEVAQKILLPIADRFANQNYYPRFLVDLSEEITNGVPQVRTMHRVQLMLEYVGESSQLGRYIFEQNDQKRESLEGSYWWMYSYEYYIDKTNQKISYITRDVVSLNRYAYVSVLATKNHYGENTGVQHYSGHYFTKNNRYLLMDLHISETREKDLRVVIDLGTGHAAIGEVFTGYYLNASNNLYFGPMLFERIPPQEKLSAYNFEEGDPDLDKVIWDYFAGLDAIPYKVIPSYGAKGRLGKFLDT